VTNRHFYILISLNRISAVGLILREIPTKPIGLMCVAYLIIFTLSFLDLKDKF